MTNLTLLHDEYVQTYTSVRDNVQANSLIKELILEVAKLEIPNADQKTQERSTFILKAFQKVFKGHLTKCSLKDKVFNDALKNLT